MLIKKAFEGLNSGGAFIVIENIIDEERKNPQGIMISLTMMLETRGGFNFGFSEFEGWTKKAGFSKTELIALANGSAAVAYK